MFFHDKYLLKLGISKLKAISDLVHGKLDLIVIVSAVIFLSNKVIKSTIIFTKIDSFIK